MWFIKSLEFKYCIVFILVKILVFFYSQKEFLNVPGKNLFWLVLRYFSTTKYYCNTAKHYFSTKYYFSTTKYYFSTKYFSATKY